MPIQTMLTEGDAYDPSHPDADWSGFVPKRSCRKRPTETPAAMRVQVTPIKDSGFLAPDENAATTDWAKPGRRINAGSAKAAHGDSDNLHRGEEENNVSSTFSLFGGPVPADDPSKFDSCQWESESGAMTKSERRTGIDQLTDAGRSMHVRGKKQASRRRNEEDVRAESPDSLHGAADGSIARNDGTDPTNLIGYRSGGMSQSFLSGLGKEVAENVGATRYVSTAPYATDGDGPTDPYVGKDGQRKKDLLLENFSSIVPGYTGKRSFI